MPGLRVRVRPSRRLSLVPPAATGRRHPQILYLDEEIRVALFLPSEELADSEADAVRRFLWWWWCVGCWWRVCVGDRGYRAATAHSRDGSQAPRQRQPA
jgi:hypothetical protein